jgi:hypothetical protein
VSSRRLAHRRLNGRADNADFLVVVGGIEACQEVAREKQRNAAAGYGTFLDRSLVACMASSTRSLRSFTSISLASAPTRMTATQLGQTPLWLVAVIIGGRLPICALM